MTASQRHETQPFARDVVAWQRSHGRHDLPWQKDRDPYRIWVSEIMLQQTQVAAVVPYYERFMALFPTVRALADAPSDDVMRAWSGLGYYARARNLHRAARIVAHERDGEFPRTALELLTLPGIGRSTAAAIAAFAFGERAAILDGNVKRVLARVFAVDGWPGESRVESELWALAEALLPDEGVEAYTQGLMDLGSGVCTRSAPRCPVCPLSGRCAALGADAIAHYPGRRPARARPHRAAAFLVVLREGQVLLERRPDAGIWGGLWCLPELRGDATAPSLPDAYGTLRGIRPLPTVEHGFTHYTLTMHPYLAQAQKATSADTDTGARWFRFADALDAGVPAPVRRILASVCASAPLEKVQDPV